MVEISEFAVSSATYNDDGTLYRREKRPQSVF